MIGEKRKIGEYGAVICTQCGGSVRCQLAQFVNPSSLRLDFPTR